MNTKKSPDAQQGLSLQEVRQRQLGGQSNVTSRKVSKTTGQILMDNICTLFNLFNVLIALALALVGAWSNMLFILIIALNTLIGIVQELHARRLVEQLSVLSVPAVRVVRQGKISEIPPEEIVMQDVIELSAGNQICADAEILTGQAEVNESLLTGESDPVPKRAGDHVLSGSFVVSGHCRACVEHVGDQNYAVQMADAAKKLKKTHSELLASMRRVTRFTGWLIPPLGLLLFGQAVLLRGQPISGAVVSTAAALLGMLPKGLVLLISVSLAVGIAALAKKKVLVQELYSLETLAHVDTLCLDKTGTLTEGKMRVEQVRLARKAEEVPFQEIISAYLQFSLDNNATFQAIQSHYIGQKGILPVGQIPNALAVRSQIPFSSERKWSAVQFEAFSFVLGAPERLLGERAAERFAEDFRQGRRVLVAGITSEPLDPEAPLPAIEELAVYILADPIRANAAETLAYFEREGIDLKLISGDNPKTVSALAVQAGFPHAEDCLDMSGVTDEAGVEYAAQHYAVFGRVSPQQKKQLVQALHRQGRCVAMTGDGVNDLLALREADCSIAVAEGSEAARQIAQVVLINNDFGLLPEVLCQGRRVVNNTTRVAGVFFVKTIYSVLLSVCCLLMNIPFPLIPIQITLIDALIEGYPAFCMSFEPDKRKVEGRFIPSVMRRALPNALSIVVCFLLIRIGYRLLMNSVHPAALLLPKLLPKRQMDMLVYLLVGMVDIQAVFKASWPPSQLRVFLCLTMTAGFYAAVFLFGVSLSLAVPNTVTLLLACGFALLSFAVERGAAWIIYRLWPEREKRTVSLACEGINGE